MTVFMLPDLGEGLDEAEIVRWHANEGDHVVADQALVAVETAKAVVEIPAPVSGRIVRLHGRPGDRIKVGAALAEFDAGLADKGAIVGELAAAPAAPAGIVAAPAIRAHARARGVDLARLHGSGPGGAITRADVDAAAAALPSSVDDPYRLHGLRLAMAEAMTRAAREVVRASVTEEADVEAWAADADVTGRLIRAIVAGIAAAPILNAHFDPRAMRIQPRATIDLGLAVDTADGLVVPVLRDVARSDASELRARIADAKSRAQARTLRPADLQGASFTLSNFGMIGGIHAVLALVPPQVAILGAGRILRRPAIVVDHLVERRALPLSLTFDHRVVTGGEAARFLRAVVADLELPS
jgi:2-oxoisovalerate dehydrogenase E2 component (dihydrolipoyl transacylase)